MLAGIGEGPRTEQPSTFLHSAEAKGRIDGDLATPPSCPRTLKVLCEFAVLAPLAASSDPDQLTQECEDIVNRLRSKSGNISDNDDQNGPDSPEALALDEDEDNIKEEKMRTPPKAPEKPADEERKPLANPKDPIALFEQKIESLITQSVETKTLQCKVCHLEYSRRSHMVEHAETHIEGFMFACNSCSETFPNRPRLRKHKPKCPGLA